MRGRTTVLALVAIAVMLLVSAVALAHEGRTAGTKDADDLTMSDGNDRVFARGGDDSVDGGAGNDRLRGGRGHDELFGGDGDDRLRGGQDDDYLDGGEGDDYINGRGDGRDGDEIVCGNGYDVAVLGRGDVIVAQGAAAEDDVESDDGCEMVKRPKARHHKKHRELCAANSQGCDDDGAIEDPCAARYTPRCGDPEVVMPGPDEPVEEPAPDEPGEY
jgi:RTX calcium-binding nonapeptide repeat (4 copies)